MELISHVSSTFSHQTFIIIISLSSSIEHKAGKANTETTTTMIVI
jgi:hypothetical protein